MRRAKNAVTFPAGIRPEKSSLCSPHRPGRADAGHSIPCEAGCRPLALPRLAAGSLLGALLVLDGHHLVDSPLMAASPTGKPRQVITDDNLRDIGKEFGVELNEDVLNYKSDDDLYC